MNIKIDKILLVLILVTGFFLRSVQLDIAPKGLQADEASFLINTVSIMETGKDEDGKLLPLFLDSLIDSKPALYSYLQIPFVKLMGPTTAASRYPSVLIGTFSIFLFYILIDKLFKNKRIALFAALLLAISPWHIMNSRATQEVVLSFTLLLANFIAGHTLFTKKFTKKYFALFFITAILSMYVYHAAKVVLVLFYFGIAALSLMDKKKTTPQKKMIFTLLGTIIVSFLITAQAALTRFSAIGLLGDDLPKALIHDYSVNSTGITPLNAIRAFYNKPIMYFKYFLETYLAHFDFNYLFTKGGATRRFSVPFHGLFYMFDLVFIPVGVYALIKKHTKKLLPWLLLLVISPIPAALTNEEIPSSIRAFTLLIPLTIASALGFEWILKNMNKKLQYVFIPFVAVFMIWSTSFFMQHLLVIMPIKNTLHRSRSYDVVSEIVANKQEQYETIQFASDLREMYIYLWQQGLISIDEIQSQPLARYEESYNLGKYYFDQESCEFGNIKPNSLLIAPDSCSKELKEKYKKIGTANFDDDTPGFVLLTN